MAAAECGLAVFIGRTDADRADVGLAAVVGLGGRCGKEGRAELANTDSQSGT